MTAVGTIDEHAVHTLLRRGDDPNTSDSNGTTPLMIAARSNAPVRMMRLLLQAGANVNATNRHGTTALMVAAHYSRDSRYLQYLLSAGANCDKADNDGYTALMFAVEEMVSDNIDAILEADPKIDAKNRQGETALLLAYPLEIVRTLLDKGANPNVSSNTRTTPIMRAVMRGNIETLRELLLHGAKPNVVDIYGYSPLIMAIESYHEWMLTYSREAPRRLSIIDGLLTGGASPTFNTLGVTPLNHAVLTNEILPVRHLMRAGAVDDGWDTTAVIMQNNVDMLRELLPTSIAHTRLDKVALQSRSMEVLEMNGGDGIAPLDYYLYVAASYNADAVLPALLEAGANPNSILLPLTVAVVEDHGAVVRQLLRVDSRTNVTTRRDVTAVVRQLQTLAKLAKDRQGAVTLYIIKNYITRVQLPQMSLTTVAAQIEHMNVLRSTLNRIGAETEATMNAVEVKNWNSLVDDTDELQRDLVHIQTSLMLTERLGQHTNTYLASEITTNIAPFLDKKDVARLKMIKLLTDRT